MPQETNNKAKRVMDAQPESLDSFKQLMDGLKNGSEEAAWKITESYSDHILRAVRKRLPKEIRSKVDSIDIVNSIWGSFLLKRNQFSKIEKPEQLIALLTVVVSRRVIDEHRKYTTCSSRNIRLEAGSYDEQKLLVKSRIGSTAEGREDTPSQIAISREKWISLKSNLSTRDKRIVALRMEGKSYDQIAEDVSDLSARSARRIIANITRMLLR